MEIIDNGNKGESLLIKEQPKERKNKEKILLEWSNINYTISLKPQKKNKVAVAHSDNERLSINNNDSDIDDTKRKILNNIEGFAMPEELMAIMGPSGCGKTSLLNIIADRQLPTGKNHIITRDVRANNIKMDQSNFGKICAYIMQDDILMDCLTPRESLFFGAKLKLKNTSELNLNKRVNKLLSQVYK